MTNNRLNVKGKFKEKQVNTKSSSPEQDMLKCDHLTQQKHGLNPIRPQTMAKSNVSGQDKLRSVKRITAPGTTEGRRRL